MPSSRYGTTSVETHGLRSTWAGLA